MRMLSLALLLSWQAGSLAAEKSLCWVMLIHFGEWSEIRPNFRLALGAQRGAWEYLWDSVHVKVAEHLPWPGLSCNFSRNTVWKSICCCLGSLHLFTSLGPALLTKCLRQVKGAQISYEWTTYRTGIVENDAWRYSGNSGQICETGCFLSLELWLCKVFVFILLVSHFFAYVINLGIWMLIVWIPQQWRASWGEIGFPNLLIFEYRTKLKINI